ncbi:MAG: DNA repair protein RecN [Alistipes sp.]|nr:DNA repair protein RecN [Alistipes sp.]
MLQQLTVENYALIERLDMELDSHLNIITGETGAGKSILLGALGLLMGNKNEGKTIRDESRNCVIEGQFYVADYGLESFFEEMDIDYEPTVLLRRVILPSGKSRAFINDMPVQLTQLKELGARLIDIHSQHQNLVIADEAFRLRSIDALSASTTLVRKYRTCYDALREAEQLLQRQIEEAESLRRDEEWLRYQVEEFEAAALKEGELEATLAELSILENADQIGEALNIVRNILDADQIGVLEQLAMAENAMVRVKKDYPSGEEFAERLHSVVQELKDLGATIASASERIDADPEKLQRLTDRVNMIYSMCQKHRVTTLEELMAVGERFAEQLKTITHSSENIDKTRQRIADLRKEANAMAQEIHALREKGAAEMTQSVEKMLGKLGMAEGRFIVELQPSEELLPTGCDRVRFLFSANGRVAPQPIEKIASGGEISRIMLAIKSLLAHSAKLPTIIFDEIDTGVSGRIADAMGEIINSLAEDMQVVAITHLPQVASKGETHFVVYKHDSRTNITRLSADERVEEVAKMLSGSEITSAAMEQARLLLGK